MTFNHDTFQQFDIIRSEYKNFYPESKLHLIKANEKTVIRFGSENGFLLPRSVKLYVDGTWGQSNYTAASYAKSIDNFVAQSFSKAELRYNNTLIEEVDYLGVASTVKCTLSHPTYGNGPDQNSGYQSTFKGNKLKFSALINLSDLGLYFFEDVSTSIVGDLTLTLTRNTNNDVVYRWTVQKDDGTWDTAKLPAEAGYDISNIVVQAVILEYEETSHIQIMKEISTKNMFMYFKSLQCIEIQRISGMTFHVDLTNLIRNENQIKYGMVVFQTDRSNDQQSDNSQYELCNVKNLWFENNGKRFPGENMNLDWTNGNFVVAYDMFCDYVKVFLESHKGRYPLANCDKEKFKLDRPIYSVAKIHNILTTN